MLLYSFINVNKPECSEWPITNGALFAIFFPHHSHVRVITCKCCDIVNFQQKWENKTHFFVLFIYLKISFPRNIDSSCYHQLIFKYLHEEMHYSVAIPNHRRNSLAWRNYIASNLQNCALYSIYCKLYSETVEIITLLAITLLAITLLAITLLAIALLAITLLAITFLAIYKIPKLKYVLARCAIHL